MPFANLGILFHIVSALHAKSNTFSIEEHEFLCSYFVLQMVEAIQILHTSEIIHADVKTDNWVVSSTFGSTDDTCVISIKLIDFGRSIDLLDLRSGKGLFIPNPRPALALALALAPTLTLTSPDLTLPFTFTRNNS